MAASLGPSCDGVASGSTTGAGALGREGGFGGAGGFRTGPSEDEAETANFRWHDWDLAQLRYKLDAR